jgi:hemerythrin superfamily protein
MFETASRFGDDLKKRALTTGDDWVRRAQSEAGGIAGNVVGRVQPYAEGLIDRLSSAADPLIRKVRPAKPTAMEEARSFLAGSGAILGVAAVGVVAGVALNAARKAAIQGSEALAGDWFEVLKVEHKAVDKLFEALLATDERQKIRRGLLLSRIAHALSKHAFQEEMVIYPALKEANSNGQAMHLYEDHAQIKIFIHELQTIAKDDPLWLERARAFRDCVQHHVREEEDVIFPAYHSRMSPQQNRRLTMMVHKEGLKLA